MNKAAVALAIISALLLSTANVTQLTGATTANPPTQWINDIGQFSLGTGDSVIQTADGAYFFTGYTPQTDSSESLSIMLVKLTEPSTVPEDSWTTKESMPTARYRFGTAVVDGKIYSIGGLTADGTVGANEVYDPATNTWETKSPMPTPRYYFAVAVYDNKIYTFGGLTATPIQNNTYVGVTEVYDSATDTWETKTSMPTNRSALCANVVDGKIILTGGIVYGPPPSFSSISEVTEVYDPETDNWLTKASIPNPVCSYASTVVDGKIYVVGGSNHSAVYTTFNQVYDLETDTWSLGASLPTGVRFASAGATSGEMAPERIYIVGGCTAQFPDGSNLTQIYDSETDAWTYGASMPTPRGGLRVAVTDDVLYAIGGFNTNGDNILAVNEQYIPIGYIPEFPSWAPLLITLVAVVAVSVIYRRRLSTSRGGADK
jgi:N-acetylneuraminic acid mutarotase